MVRHPFEQRPQPLVIDNIIHGVQHCEYSEVMASERYRGHSVDFFWAALLGLSLRLIPGPLSSIRASDSKDKEIVTLEPL